MGYRPTAELKTPGGTKGENADLTENGGDGAGTGIPCKASSPDNIASIACTTSPRYFWSSVSTSLRRRVGNTLIDGIKREKIVNRGRVSRGFHREIHLQNLQNLLKIYQQSKSVNFQ